MNEQNPKDGCGAGNALPEEHPDYEGVVREVRSWARDGEPVPRLDMARLRSDVEGLDSGRKRRIRSIWSGAGWLIAAASLCILAMSFGEFRVECGSFNFQVGRGMSGSEVESLQAQLADIQKRFDLNRSEYSAAIESLSNRTIALENDLNATTVKLIRAQEAESATRYNEISSILSMTSRRE